MGARKPEYGRITDASAKGPLGKELVDIPLEMPRVRVLPHHFAERLAGASHMMFLLETLQKRGDIDRVRDTEPCHFVAFTNKSFEYKIVPAIGATLRACCWTARVPLAGL
jgi:hypothetical protein